MADFTNVAKNLKLRGYEVTVCSTKEEAAKYVDSKIDNTTVGIGGSATVKASGLYDLLVKHNEVHWHWVDSKQKDAKVDGGAQIEGHGRDDERKLAMNTEIYICSANALSEDGYMVNVDGNGNRVASTLYGHKKLYFMIGKNKLVADMNAAIDRAKNYCPPIRAQQTGKSTPCVKDLKCHNCLVKDRACKAMVIYMGPQNMQEVEVVLIDEDLGI